MPDEAKKLEFGGAAELAPGAGPVRAVEMRVLLYRGVSLLSRAIQWQTWSDYSHAALQIRPGLIVDAWKQGIRVISDPFDGHSRGTSIDVFSIPDLSDAQAQLAADFALTQIGKRYDVLAILRFLTRRDTGSESLLFCSELLALAFERAAFPLLERVPPWRQSPGDLGMSPRLHLERQAVRGRFETGRVGGKAGAAAAVSAGAGAAAKAAAAAARARVRRAFPWGGFVLGALALAAWSWAAVAVVIAWEGWL